jgi:hypothetical protein
MRVQQLRVLLVFCLAFGFGLVGVSSPAAAADKKKSWPSKKHHKAHKASKPVKASTGGAAPATADDADDDSDDDADDSKSAAKDDSAKAKPKAKAQATDAKPSDDKADDGEREASDDRSSGGGDDDDEGGSTVVHRKAKRPTMESGNKGAIALEVTAGPRGIHRTFDFNDPLYNRDPSAHQPFAYKLRLAPAPFLDLGFYPGAFATRGMAASFGLVARYEKLVATQTADNNGNTFNTLGQQLEVGVRGRMPVGEHEVGVTASYGKHTFHIASDDPGPAMGSQVPNVDYTFVGLGIDGRVRLSPIEIGAHVGTRFVMKTGDLASVWFSTTKTTSIDAGFSIAYQLTPLFSVVGGMDFLRYAFDFNPVDPNAYLVAGGAVDQYISGFLALRVTLSGS